MTSKNFTGYCTNCKQKVLLIREKFNTLLAVLLFFFTGIGFFIYLIIYYNKPKDHCIHCNTKIYSFDNQILQRENEAQTQKVYKPSRNEKVEEISGIIPKFCSFCGEQLSTEDSKYCPNCGTKI